MQVYASRLRSVMACQVSFPQGVVCRILELALEYYPDLELK